MSMYTKARYANAYPLRYYLRIFQIDYVLDAVRFVAEHGFKFLFLYKFNHVTGDWAHAQRFTKWPQVQP
jgi:hypothetical protein